MDVPTSEKKLVQKWNPGWKQTFKWLVLEYDDEQQMYGMKCKICKAHANNSKSPFGPLGIGARDFQVDIGEVKLLVDKLKLKLAQRYVENRADYLTPKSKHLHAFLEKHGSPDKREITIRGLDKQGTACTIKDILHENPIGNDKKMDLDSYIKLGQEFAQELIAKLDYCLGDLKHFDGAKLFMPMHYPPRPADREGWLNVHLYELLDMFKEKLPGLGASIARSTPAVRNPFEYPSATSPAIKATSAAMNTSANGIPTVSEPWEEAISSQLAAWFDDSHWTDEPPSMTVTVGDHGRGQLDGVATVALPPDTVFSILCDPHNRRVFTFIKSVKNERVVSDCNGVRVVELDIVFALKVPFFTGTFDAHLRNVHDRPNRRVTFCLSRPGFMRKFEGYWQVDPLLVPASATYATSPSSAASAASAAPSASDVPSFLSAEGDPESELFPSVSFTPQSPLSDVMFLGSSCDSDSESGSDLNASGSDSSNSASSSPDRFPARVIPDPTTTTSVGSLCGSGGGLGEDDTRGSGRLGEDSGLGAEGGLGADGGLGGDAGMRVASRLVLHQVVEPSLAPPPMFRRCVHALLKAATRDVLVVFQYEAARIRNSKGKFPWRNGAEAGAEEGEEEGKGKAGKSSKLGAMFLHKEALGGKNSVFGVGKGGFGLKKPAQRKA
ncbi:unnamed protein product [Closterium sp. NIES-65]|nr:unnamed protein product [Closterium sp. NIES-65]